MLLTNAKALVIETLTAELAEDEKLDEQEVGKLFGSLEKKSCTWPYHCW